MLNVSVRKYGNSHVAVRIMVNGKSMGWIQIEKTNLAYYGTTAKNSMHLIRYGEENK